tara:strand:+ start:723 stop:986 length:264 start_codon:yes stop_codon:yes gene_type:complete
MTIYDKIIYDAIKLYNSSTTSQKIINSKKINFKNLDSLAKMNLATSFEEVLNIYNKNVTFGNNEKDFFKIFKNYESLIEYIKQCLRK